tara:strand:+ start:3493 stop:5331 length:1839 start_codon:yes stop_codon:yes gene_type:complete
MGGKKPRFEGPPKWSEPLLRSVGVPVSSPRKETTTGKGTAGAVPLAEKPASRKSTSTTSRFHLSVVRELHTRGTATGASIDHTVEPAWLDITLEGDAIIKIGGGCPLAVWRVDRDTNDVSILSNDENEINASLFVSVGNSVSSGNEPRAFVLQFVNKHDAHTVKEILQEGTTDVREKDRAQMYSKRTKNNTRDDLFDKKIDGKSAAEYFEYYASLAEQQNMLQDRIRTGTYFTAIIEHSKESFKDKIVLDVGAGSGILSCFAALAGARRVYAVEASNMANHCETLVNADPRLRDVVKVIKGRVESTAVKVAILEDLRMVLGSEVMDGNGTEKKYIDTLISEPMGTLLFNERMIESYLIARDIYLKPNGDMFPNQGRVHCSLFEDGVLHHEINDKASFWTSRESADFYGVDLSPLRKSASSHYFRQPVVDAFGVDCLLTDEVKTFEFDFLPGGISASDLEHITMPYSHSVNSNCTVHGVAFWFDVEFSCRGSQSQTPNKKTRYLTTAPGQPTTHWFQMRLPFEQPLEGLTKGQIVSGQAVMKGLPNQSYEIESSLATDGKNKKNTTGAFNLKDPYYRQLQFPQPGYTEAQTKRWYGNETADVGGSGWNNGERY